MRSGSSSERPRAHAGALLAALAAVAFLLGCGEKFDLPPVPEAVPPQPGSYNFARDWQGVGQVRDMVLVGGDEGALYVLTERGGVRSIEGYYAGFPEATEVDGALIGRYPGLRRPTSMTYAVSGQEYLYVVDQRGPADLVRESTCDGDDCAMAFRAAPGASTTRHLAGRVFEDGVDRDFVLRCRLRVDELAATGKTWLALGTAEGRVGIWLEVYRANGGTFLHPVRSDGAFPVDSTAFALDAWHDVEVTMTWATGLYEVAVDGATFTERVPVYHRLNRPLRGFAIRLEGDTGAGAIDDLRIVAPDVDPPGRILDLEGTAVSTSAADLTWTAPGDGFSPDEGRAVEYEIQWAPRTRDFDVGSAEVVSDPFPPSPGGETETYRLESIPLTDTVYVAIRARDDGLNWSALSNLALVDRFTPREAPHVGPDPSQAIDETHGTLASRRAVAPRGGDRARGGEAVPDTVLEVTFDDPAELDLFDSAPYFVNDPAPAILRFGLRTEVPVRTFTDPGWVVVHGVAVEPDGTLLVSVREKDPDDPTGVLEQGQIVRMASSGERLPSLADAGSGLGFVNDPRDLATDGFDVVVADVGQAWVQKLDATAGDGQFLIPDEPQDDPWFQTPTGIALDVEGYIYVSDPTAGRVLRFAPSGSFADTVYAPSFAPTEAAGLVEMPIALAADSDEVWLADPADERIVVLKKADAISSDGGTP